MIKKLIATLALSSVLLVGCAGNSAADEKETKDSIESESAEIVESEEKEEITDEEWNIAIALTTTIDSWNALANNEEFDNNKDMMSDLVTVVDEHVKSNNHIKQDSTNTVVSSESGHTPYADEFKMIEDAYAPKEDEIIVSVLSQQSTYGKSVKERLSEQKYHSGKIPYENENYFVLVLAGAYVNNASSGDDTSSQKAQYIDDLFTSDAAMAVYEKHLN